MTIIRERLRQRRQQLRLSQTDLERMAGLTQSSVSRWEIEESVIESTNLVRLARVLNVSTDWLLGLTDVEKPYPPPK